MLRTWAMLGFIMFLLATAVAFGDFQVGQLALAPSNYGDATWGDQATPFTWTFDAGDTDPTMDFASNLTTFNHPVTMASTLGITGATTLTSTLDVGDTATGPSGNESYPLLVAGNIPAATTQDLTSALCGICSRMSLNIDGSGTYTNLPVLYLSATQSAGSSTSTTVSGLEIGAPVRSSGTWGTYGSVIINDPGTTATTNYALWVKGGTVQFDGKVELADSQWIKMGGGAPVGTDCDAAAEEGRLWTDTTNGLFYVCDQTGASTGWATVLDFSS